MPFFRLVLDVDLITQFILLACLIVVLVRLLVVVYLTSDLRVSFSYVALIRIIRPLILPGVDIYFVVVEYICLVTRIKPGDG